MVYALQFEIFWRNAARRDGSAGNIATQLATRSLLTSYAMANITQRQSGNPGLSLMALYIDAASRDADLAALDALLGTGTNGPVTGSRAWTHDCAVDEGGDALPCVVANERTW